MLAIALLGCSDKVHLHDSTDGDPTFSTVPIPPEGEPALAFAGDRPKNVLMISIDTTRRDAWGSYNPNGKDYLPFLNSLLQSGFHLDDHQQCSNWTFHSTSCTLAGRFSEDTGYIPQLSLSGRQDLPADQQTLAVRLKAQGYYNILVSSNGWLGPEWNNAQGYDEAPPPFTGNTTALLQFGMDQLAEAKAEEGVDKWLLHIHLIEPHPPYVPPVEYRTEEIGLDPMPEGWDLDNQASHYLTINQWPKMTPEQQDLLVSYLTARYHGELQYMDDQVAAMWPVLDEAGLLDDTLVVVWTDHGEQFFEHGNQTHAWDLAAEENDAIQFFWAKNLPPRAWTRPTHAVDMMPTVLDALGYPADPYDPLLSGYTVGTAPDSRPRFTVTAARGGPRQTVTLNDQKLLFDHDGELRYYDRVNDRFEMNNLYTGPNDEVLELWNLMLPRIYKVHDLVPLSPLVWPAGLPTE